MMKGAEEEGERTGVNSVVCVCVCLVQRPQIHLLRLSLTCRTMTHRKIPIKALNLFLLFPV